jgi:hypothetical protein
MPFTIERPTHSMFSSEGGWLETQNRDYSLAFVRQCNQFYDDLIERFGKQRFVWQQDNAPAHQRWLAVLDWRSHSPELSRIEMVWSIINGPLPIEDFGAQD